MKRVMLAGILCALSGGVTYGQENDIETKEAVVYDVQHTINVALNDNTVLCSDADYGAKFLKVLIPDLKDLTLFNHRNERAAAPCVAAGMCRGVMGPRGNLPSDIIDPTKPTETVSVHIKLVRLSEINHREKSCKTYLIEQLHVPIRGVDFTHQREGELDHRPYEDCL